VSTPPSSSARASADVQTATAWLETQWRLPTRLSTIPQAMAAMGRHETDDFRWDVSVTLARDWRKRLLNARTDSWSANPERLAEFTRQLRTWGFAMLVLTASERLIGAALVQTPSASQSDISDRLGVPLTDVERAFSALERVGLVSGERLAFRHGRVLSGLGLASHVVTVVATGETFNTTCAIDYVLLAKNIYPHHNLRLVDYCTQSLAPIDVIFGSRQVLECEGPEPLLYRGGKCGTNLLFRSQADFLTWLSGTRPKGPAGLLGDWLANWPAAPRLTAIDQQR